MKKEQRQKELEKIQTNREPERRKKLSYKNESQDMDVWKIPVDCLVFNKHNGRIGTYVRTYEKVHKLLDAVTDEGEKNIIDFLWKSQKGRNRKTLEDIEKKGQLEPGIVTKDGIIIDGNRRYMLLKIIAEKDNSNPIYFDAIILDETLESNPKEIKRLETTFQIGSDEKVAYGAIEKYLKCKDLIDSDFSIAEVAEMMQESKSTIEEYLEVFKLMEDYLVYLDYSGMYDYLVNNKVEEPLLGLCRWLKKHDESPQGRDWIPEKEDLGDLKIVCFDYVRAGFGPHDEDISIRRIGNPARGRGIFSNKEIWENFSKNHFKVVGAYQEPSLDEIREKRVGEPLPSIISSRDEDWANAVGAPNSFKNALMRGVQEHTDKVESSKPIELLNRAKSTLENVNYKLDSFIGPDLKDVCHAIRKLAEKFIKEIDGKSKGSGS